jgi:phage tail-like protein
VETRDPLGNPQGAAPVMLLTPVALKPGQRYVSRTSQITVTVTGATHNGFNVTVDTPLLPFEETQDSQTGEPAMAPEKSPSYSFLVALKDAHGAEQPFGGFAEASGLPRKLTGLQKTTDVTLKRGTVSAKSLEDWIGSVRSGGLAIRKQVVLIQRDETGTQVGSWHLTGAYPTKWEGPTLGAKGNDVAIEELVLSPEGIEWIPPK